jgi:hypothetical protein
MSLNWVKEEQNEPKRPSASANFDCFYRHRTAKEPKFTTFSFGISGFPSLSLPASMTYLSRFLILLLGTSFALADTTELYRDVSETALPIAATKLRSMDAEMGDIDGDGDLDIFVAMEFSKNLLLVNRGDGTFADGSSRLPDPVHDSEDIALGDFDADGDLDAIIVAEDDRTDLYYRNNGEGHYAMHSLPPAEVTNGINHGDLDGDGDPDLITANAGASNAVWLNHAGDFTLMPHGVTPQETTSQDVQLGDLDGDGDLDLVEANEGPNRVLLNRGDGKFIVSQHALPDIQSRETRQAAIGDVDGDGDLDIIFGNVFFGFSRRQGDEANGFANRLFLNLGDATFKVSDGLPEDQIQSAHIDLVDLDHDGDLDIIATSIEELRQPGTGRVHAYLNDGAGTFIDQTAKVFPDTFHGNGFDVAVGDVNGDGKVDLYLANRIGEDRLLLAQ